MINPVLKEELAVALNELFGLVKLKLLGAGKAPKEILVSFKNPKQEDLSSLQRHYLDGMKWHGNVSVPDQNTIKRLEEVAEKYIDALETKSEADLLKILSDYLDDAVVASKVQGLVMADFWQTSKGQDILSSLQSELKKEFEKIKQSADLIVDHQTMNAQNFGAFDGIMEASKKIGIEDPQVFKLLFIFERACKTCRRLYLLPDGITPRVYKMSEMAAQPIDTKGGKAQVPSIAPSHPRCCCLLSTCLPGWGFKDGKLHYFGEGHDEWLEQHKKYGILP